MGGESAINQSAMASSGTQAVNTDIQVDLALGDPDGFVCAAALFHRTIIVPAIVLRISSEAVVGTPTASTQVGTLKVWNATQGVAMSEAWLVWDMPNAAFPALGTLVTLKNTSPVQAAPGDEIQIVYNQTGAKNDGSVGGFQIIAIETELVTSAVI